MSRNLIFAIFLILFSIDGTQTIGKAEEVSYPRSFNSSDFYTIWDVTNIPEDILKSSTKVEEILEAISTRKYRSCKASVLYHPLKKIYYFRNPSKYGRAGSMKDYMPLKCRSFPSRSISLRQRFYIPFKDIEQLLDNNEDSIFLEGIHEITDLRNGLELSLFPIKFYRALQMPETNYFNPKDLLCYDSIKVMGIDKNNFDYFIVSAMDKHKILYCDSMDLNKKNNLNNFIRYSVYCDEFCAEDYIYFSNDLIKCKCDFFSYVEDLKKNKNFIINNNDTDGCHYARRLDRYEIFANPYEIAEKITRLEEQNKSYLRYYLHIIIIIFTFQILYAFYFTTKNSVFIKFSIILYIILSIIFYVPYRLKLSQIDIVKVFEVVTDLYPVILLIVISCDPTTKQYDILKLSFVIFVNSFDQILKEIPINEFELVVRLIFLISSFLLGNTVDSSGTFIQFYNMNVRYKHAFELISRFCLYLAEHNIISNISVPLFIILGRPRESQISSDHLLFQTNYLKLKPNFDQLYENWFMEALNFHKFKNMILFLKFFRYFLVVLVLSFINTSTEINKIVTHFMELRFNRIIFSSLVIGFKNGCNVNFCSNQTLNRLHIPILVSFLFTNIFLTKDSLKIFLVHFVIGLILMVFTGKHNHKKNPGHNVGHPNIPPNIAPEVGNPQYNNVNGINNN